LSAAESLRQSDQTPTGLKSRLDESSVAGQCGFVLPDGQPLGCGQAADLGLNALKSSDLFDPFLRNVRLKMYGKLI
jgi:hypothetical protein